MTALSRDRNTPERSGHTYTFPVKAGETIWRGALVMLEAGEAVAGRTATGLVAAGRAETGTAEDPGRVTVRRGVFRFANAGGGDAVTDADYGAAVYCVDDQTVARTSGGGTRSAAGICRGVDAAGVWVEI
ncbi:hypothetical protein GCM10010964_18620 [Caldovatus sediminis]|uniref:Uncharacterized protein n=1 Tax=Caldovatus sediminis TaxID=2041189 RepID=A0A8J3EC28_9PROT|nr:hypothetical protein [Caldovatus sediminis]GGG30951.1 hypothetical protein GCM10010964_18620 [Caldovatus sediminis]